MARWFAPFLLLLLAACSSPALRSPGSSDYVYPAGMHIQLERNLTIPAGSATVRLQHGQPVAFNRVQETEPYCIFEISSVRSTARAVAPADFTVTRVEHQIQDFAGMPVLPDILPFGRGPSQMYFITRFHLQGGKNSEARSLSCQSDQLSYPLSERGYLSLREMKEAVGGYFSFKLPRG